MSERKDEREKADRAIMLASKTEQVVSDSSSHHH